MESEMLCYKQKVDQMTVLLRHYQNELESQKVRRDGVETVSRLLAESRQENATLKKALINMETSAKNLKNRLVANGISAEADPGDADVIVPGTSKQTLTNLAVENKRLRSMLQHDSADSVNESDSLRKSSTGSETEHTLQQTVDKLQAENKSMKMKLSDLESLYKSSNNEKDRQLISLQAEVEQLRSRSGEKTGATKPLTSLPALKEQLRAFMAHCQALESSLDQAPESTEVTSKEAVERPDGDCVDGEEMKALQEEKQKLQDRVEEVTKMNQRWQEFFNERNRYTQSLEQRVQDLDERLKEAMRAGPTQEINRRIEQVLEKSQKEISQMDELRQKAEDEVQVLRQQLAEKEVAMGQLQSQVTILSRNAPHHLATSAQSQRAAEANSTIEHLKYQIQVCTEDFEKERQDRQIALQKISNLQEQVSQLQKLNTHLQTMVQNQQTMQPAHHNPQARPPAQEHGLGEAPSQNLQPRGALYHHHHQAQAQALSQAPRFDYEYDCPRSPPNNSSSGDGWRDYPDFDFEVPGPEQHHLHHPMSFPGGSSTAELIARGTPPQQHLPKLSLSDSALSTASASSHSLADAKQNILTCPKCNREFSEEHQEELLAHMDECWE